MTVKQHDKPPTLLLGQWIVAEAYAADELAFARAERSNLQQLASGVAMVGKRAHVAIPDCAGACRISSPTMRSATERRSAMPATVGFSISTSSHRSSACATWTA